MPSSKLGAGDFGDAVASVHAALASRGIEVSAEERKRQFFGPTTREAIRKFQLETGLDPTCEVCESTAQKLASNQLVEFDQHQPQPNISAEAKVTTPVSIAAELAGGVRPQANAEPTKHPGTFSSRIGGVIALAHGSPASEINVRLYQRGFGGALTLLNEGRTDVNGAYTIPYSLQGAASVEIFAVGADGTEVQLSRTKFDLQPDEQIDLIAPSAIQPQVSEFKRLMSAIALHTDNQPELLKDASELGDKTDFSHLAGMTGWDAGAIALASEALDTSVRTGIPSAGLYALARVGLPANANKLAQVSKETVGNALRRAAEAGVVDSAVVSKSLEAFKLFAADFKFSNRIQGALSSPKEFVEMARISNTDRDKFARVVRDDSTENLWERAKAEGVSDDGISKLQLQGKLAYLTFNNVRLADHLAGMLVADPLELIGLGFYEEPRWDSTLRQLAQSDGEQLAALIPPSFAGRTTDERVTLYAQELARRVRQMDPHAVTVERIAAGKLEGVAESTDVGVFLKNATKLGFRLGTTPLGHFEATHREDIWKGIHDDQRESVLNSMRTLSSLYASSPDDEALSALLQAGFDSATSIAKHDYNTFFNRIKPYYQLKVTTGAKSVPEQVFWKAQQQSATVFNIFDGLKRLHSTMYAPGSTSEDVKARDDQIQKTRQKLSGLFPTLENLFGSVDYCECQHCRSVLSPAAYLVDILHFLDPDEQAWATMKGSFQDREGIPYTKNKPFNVLDGRRPDIKNIALTCENTNTALPYIDIVNEVLEQVMMAGQSPPIIEAYDVGDVASPDLLAEPQHILWSAYVGAPGQKGLRDLVYPHTLPFDLPLETARGFLKQLKLPLWRLREVLARPSTLNPSGNGRTDGWVDVWFERLGLGNRDVAALTRAENWYELFGYESQGDAVLALSNGKTLARRLGVSYEELVDLIRTQFINPEIENLIILKNLGVDPNLIDRHLGEGTALSESEKSDLEAWLKAQDLTPADLAPLRTTAIRKATIVLRSPSAGCDFSQTTLAFDQEPAAADQAFALVLRRMNAFVRLKKKLGWETHELDRALMALMPGVANLTMATWPEAMKTALIYLAHVEQLREHFVDRVSREELLVLWSDIPTTGLECLYERLFFQTGGIGRDPALKKRLGKVLEDQSKELLDHADAIRQALQVSHDDLEPILKAAGATDRSLSIANLSILMRYAVLARGLDLSISDLLVLIGLSEKRPLSPLDHAPLTDLAKDVPWSETIAFVHEVDLVHEAGVDVAFLNRICLHRDVTEQPTPEADPVLIALAALPAQTPSTVLVQTLAAQLSATEPLINLLIGHAIKDGSNKPIKDEGFSLSSRDVSVRRLRKALDLIQSLGITDAELEYLLSVSDALNPNDLPLKDVNSVAISQNLRKGLSPWLELASARRQFGRSERLLAVFSASRQPIDTYNTLAVREKQLHEAIAALTGFKVPMIALALDAIGAKTAGGSMFEISTLASPAKLRQTLEALKCFSGLGLRPSDVVRFATAVINEDAAKQLRAAVKGRYKPSAWRRLAKPVFDELRKKQRDALVAHLTHVMNGKTPKYGDTAEKLFEYLLLDPGMEPVVIASRIQLAISSVQLFVQRCLMNLEQDVDPRIIDKKRWEWMSRYRVWEVNRKFFIWPENWLNPEFRDDKTHLFRELEGRLLQGDINDDLVRSCLHSYLKGLEEIARLEMLTMYFEPGISAVHVVGRTQNSPHKYFYRNCSQGMWTPWEPIDVGIEGEHLLLSAWRGRIYLFWLSFLEQTRPPTVKDTVDATKPQNTSELKGIPEVKLQLHWAERLQNKWANRASTAGFLPTSIEGVKATTEDEKRLFNLRAKTIEHGAGTEDDDLEIRITHPQATGHKFVFFSKLAAPRSENCTDSLTGVPFTNVTPKATKWTGNDSLKVEFLSSVTQDTQAEKPGVTKSSLKILGGSGGFSLLLPSNEKLPVPARRPPAGVGRPTGYVFRPQNSQHVAYRSGDGSIHDLFWTRNGWFYQSPSTDAADSGPGDIEPAQGDPHGYVLDDKGTICIAYAGSTKIQELVWSQLDSHMDDSVLLSTGWRAETLYLATDPSGQPQGRPLGGLFLPSRGVVFRTRDGLLKAAIATGADPAWAIESLNSNLPLAKSDPTGLLMTQTESGVVRVVSRHIFWVGVDDNLHELRKDAAAKDWTYTNITQGIKDAVKPAPGATPAAYAFLAQNTLHVVYRGIDQQIHELWGPPGSWNYNPIGKGFTKAKGDPIGYVTEGFFTQHVVYRGVQDEVVELWWSGIWRENILSKTTATAAKTASDVAGYSFEANKSQHVVYYDSDGALCELWWADTWHPGNYELTNPFTDDLSPLASPFFYEAASKDHTFFIEPYVVETAVHEWKEWIVTTTEYVEPRIDERMLVSLNPNILAFKPSDVSLHQIDATRFSNRIFDEPTLIRTSKGVIKPDIHMSLLQSGSAADIVKEATLIDTGVGTRVGERLRWLDPNMRRL